MTEVQSLLQRITELEKRVDALEKQKPKQAKKLKKEDEFKGLAGAIFDLIQESFFDKPRELNEIQKQLKANGVFYPVTSYPDSLLRLVRKKKLRRINEKGWRYVKYG